MGSSLPRSTPSENVQPKRRLASTFPCADKGAVNDNNENATNANATSGVTFLNNMIDLLR